MWNPRTAMVINLYLVTLYNEIWYIDVNATGLPGYFRSTHLTYFNDEQRTGMTRII